MALDLLGWYVTAFAIIVMVYLAATQVGSTFDTFLFSGVFLAALPVLCLTHTVMCQSYLAGWNYDMKWQIFCVLTPVLTMIGSYTTYGEWLYAAMAIWLAAGVLLLWAAVRLYTRRPSERAESRCREGLAAGVFRFIATFVGGSGLRDAVWDDLRGGQPGYPAAVDRRFCPGGILLCGADPGPRL